MGLLKTWGAPVKNRYEVLDNDFQQKRLKLNNEIAMFAFSENVIPDEKRNLYLTIRKLRDDTYFLYEKKKEIWNHSNIQYSSEYIFKLYEKQQETLKEEHNRMDKITNRPYIGPIIISLIYFLLLLLYNFTWRNTDSFIWFLYPKWGTILAIVLIPLSIFIQAKIEINQSIALGMSPYSQFITESRKTACASLAVGTVAAGFVAKAVNNKIKKESQVKKNF